MSDCLSFPLPMRFVRGFLTVGLTAIALAASAQGCALICKSNLNVALNGVGQALITEQLIAPTASTFCPGTISISLFDENYEPAPNPLTCDYLGQTITVVLEHVATGNTCSGTLEVRDYLPPQLSCANQFVLCTQDPDPAFIGQPLVTDNCTPAPSVALSYSDQFTDLPCNATAGGQAVTARIDRSWQAADQSGNTSTCLQQIWIKKAVLQDVSFPPNLDGFQAAPLSCGQDPNDLALTGSPTIEGQAIEANGNCDLAAFRSDQIINNCGTGSYTVLRTWTVSDFCGSGSVQQIQVIKVQDLIPPTIDPPEDMTFGTTDFNCSGWVELATATASDECSSVTVQASWAYGNGYGPFLVPDGTHTVTYTATDACGNTATATARVTVVDDDPPQVICVGEVQVAISASGIGYVLPATLDAGSWDNCSALSLEVSRDGDIFAPLVQVNCADIGTPLQIYLRATDGVGLENFCIVDVTVRDFIKPTLNCPANISINCTDNNLSPQHTGQAQASDNCVLQNIVYQDVASLNACGAGTVQRTWTASDAAGNTRTCVQQISIQTLSTISVGFPPNKTIGNCASAADLLPASTGQPLIGGQSCSPVSVTYTDQVFAAPPAPACFSILRSWKVIDWCVYNGGQTGLWQQTQLITVEDHSAPALGLPANQIVDAAPGSCSAWVQVLPAVATDCSSTVLVSNNSLYAASSGSDASGAYPVGLHQVVFTATDACGNTAQQTLTIQVRDQSAPLLTCLNNVTQILGPGGVVALNPNNFVASVSDNCTPSAVLVLTVSPAAFDCSQTGPQTVLVTAADAAGNIAACQSLVSVQAPPGICAPADTYSIIGTIRTETQAPVTNVPVDLQQGVVLQQVLSDTAGVFGFSDLPDQVSDLRPHYDEGWVNGVSTFDLALISKHILGIQPLSSPYKMIAADANHSNSITTFDIVLLRKLLLGVSDTIEGNTSWRFVAAGYVFPDPNNPFSTPFPEAIHLDSLAGVSDSAQFIGVKIGDVNNSTNPVLSFDAGDPLRPGAAGSDFAGQQQGRNGAGVRIEDGEELFFEKKLWGRQYLEQFLPFDRHKKTVPSKQATGSFF